MPKPKWSHHIDGVFGEFFPARKAKARLDESRLFKKKTRLPLMLVGGIRSVEMAERILTEGIADYISLGRPLIREPGLIARWMSGDTRKSTCISDNGCFKPGLDGEGVHSRVRAD
jgi:2,4-dienoyl-CoA reductase-like NADH-dependent reductase (Old Yellow Enzyme family)